MNRLLLHCWCVKWFNPYSESPAGYPRILAEAHTGPDEPIRCPVVLDELLNKLGGPGCGWVIAHGTEVLNPRKLSPQTKGRIRWKAHVRRVRSKAPLFENQILESTKDNPYFKGGSRSAHECS